MNRFIKGCTAFSSALVLSLGIAAYAQEFPDMPDNWTTAALENAVSNGLLNGSDGKILPDNSIKRSEMAAIMVRAFGAEKKADLSDFSDMSEDKWYYDSFSAAVAMGAFSGDDNGKLNPEASITFEECFAVVSRIFYLDEYKGEDSRLEAFSDYGEIADWAKPYMSKIVDNGYWDGVDGKLKPKAAITRAEFAVLMDNLVKLYITEPGEYEYTVDGNVMIRGEGITLKDSKINGSVFIGDGTSSDIELLETEVSQKVLVRAPVTVKMTGYFEYVETRASGSVVDVSEASCGGGYICSGSTVVQPPIGDVSSDTE